MRCMPILLIGLLLAGCGSESVVALYADYLARLSRVTGVEVPENALTTESLRYPRGRERRLSVPEVTGSVLEIFRLERCNVAELIAERNSILGRHADTAAHLAIGGRVLRRLRACRDKLDTGDAEQAELHAHIDAILTDKRAALAAQAWNASLGSNAMADWWSPSGGALEPDSATMPGDGLAQLAKAVAAGLAGAREDANAGFSSAYQQLERQRYGGAWVNAAQTSLAGLSAAVRLLESTDTNRLCPQGQPTPEARILQTILQQRYFGTIQPLLATLDRAAERMRTPLEAMWPARDALPEAVRAFRADVWASGPTSLQTRLVTMSRRHAEAWEAVLTPCGLEPERATNR